MPNNDQKPAAPAAPVAPTAPTTPAVPPYEQLLSMFVSSQQQIAQLLEQQQEYNKQALRIAPRRKKTMAEYLAKNPRKYLKHDVYQNGHLVNPKGLSQATLDTLDTLASGTYCDGMVHVIRIRDGVGGISSRIHLRYSNMTQEQRMTFYIRFPTFTKIVQDVADEMKARRIPPVHDAAPDPPAFAFPEEEIALA